MNEEEKKEYLQELKAQEEKHKKHEPVSIYFGLVATILTNNLLYWLSV